MTARSGGSRFPRVTTRRFSTRTASTSWRRSRSSCSGACDRSTPCVEAYRTGEGVPYADYGSDLYRAQAAFTRPLFVQLLAQEWLPALSDVDARLRADPPARVADLACGGGVSSVAIAKGYPKVSVDGIDLDAPSIEQARAYLAGSGVEDRVEFHVRDAADPQLRGRYDLVTIFEAVHDMSYPVAVLRAARELLSDGGCVIVGDELTAEAFGSANDDLERLYYGFSILHCLPVGMIGEDAAGTGTVMRADTLERYAQRRWLPGRRDCPDRERLLAFLRPAGPSGSVATILRRCPETGSSSRFENGRSAVRATRAVCGRRESCLAFSTGRDTHARSPFPKGTCGQR